MAVGLHAVVKANLGASDAPLVIGCGPVGLAVIAALKLRGVGPIVAADFSPMRRKLAETLGADHLIDPRAGSAYAELARVAAGPQRGDLRVRRRARACCRRSCAARRSARAWWSPACAWRTT